MTAAAAWPDLGSPALPGTLETLQLWSQIVGKVRLANAPWLNHAWQVTLYVSPRGLSTSLIPHGDKSFSLEFDFIDQHLVLRATDGGERRIPLASGTVAEFYDAVMQGLTALGLETDIHAVPDEMPEPVPFAEDDRPRAYDPDVAHAYWLALVQVDRVLNRFRTRFLGKCSPVHLFWGAFDMAVTRFSGRRAPLHPGGVPHLPDAVTREAYSHEVSSAGFWPGGNGVPPSFYAYAYPTPKGFAEARVQPEGAAFSEALGEFLLPYEAVRQATDPDAALLAFLQSTYEAAADLGGWDRADLECAEGVPGRPRAVR
ncbi:DUF5996 family protein [Brevundimonas sp. Root1279]|uniref:DUF5996 family protein n=1 Tax=Brevundimonas sp. Root1279 TaxID=1736443 RepID=UPI0006FE6103|nr:DUF5996 family protein [Brevundimonas sp. Root1279]KQW82384.1 hypothetical protein ASC65_09025 [Brevundimonas sp. Root1279]